MRSHSATGSRFNPKPVSKAIGVLLIFVVLLATIAAVSSQAKAPALRIDAPKEGQGLKTTEVTVKVKVSNFKLDAAGIGGANLPGRGHLHILIDGVSTVRTAKSAAKFTGLSPGQHSVLVELSNNDRTSLSPPVAATATFGYELPAKPGKVGKDTVHVFPAADFTASVTAGRAPLSIQFSDTSKNGPNTWGWDFGDGTSSTEQNPSHQYTKAGSYSISVSVSNKAGSNTAAKAGLVTVKPGPLARLEFSPKDAVLPVEGSQGFEAVPYDQFENPNMELPLTFKADPRSGVVDQKGNFKAGTKAGAYENGVTVEVTEGSATKTATAAVTVRPGPLDSVKLQPAAATVEVGKEQKFTPTALDRFDNPISGLSYAFRPDEKAGKAGIDGRFTAGTKAGVYDQGVTVEVTQGPVTKSATAKVTLKHGPLDRVLPSPVTVTLDIGKSQQFTAQAVDAYGNPVAEAKVTWVVADKVGTIDDKGLLTVGTKAGTFDQGVKATTTIGEISKAGTAMVTVKPGPPVGIVVGPGEVRLPIGGKEPFTIQGADRYGNPVPLAVGEATWLLLKEAGSLDAKGLFTAGKAAGSYKDAVQARAVVGATVHTATASVTVLPDPLDRVELLPRSAVLGISMPQQFVAVARDQFGNILSDVVFAWSAREGGILDGKQLLTAGEKPGAYQDTVKVVARQGDRTREATATITVDPDRIAFVSNRDRVSTIYLMDADGSNVTRITAMPSGEFVESLSPSPDGQRLLFTRVRLDTQQRRLGAVHIVNTDGSGLNTVAGGWYPAWSPDGKQTVFMGTRDGNDEIYIMNADGSNQTRLTTHSESDIWPALSPDGKRIAFASRRTGNYELHVMDADGQNVHQLTRGGQINARARWSPDGRKIAFESNRDRDFEIFVIDADGRNETQLTRNTVSDRDPVWSPDGRQILFSSNRDENFEVYVMNADGSNQTRVTNNAAFDGSAVWMPRKKGVKVEQPVTAPVTVTPGAGTAEEAVTRVKGTVVRLTGAAGQGSGVIVDSNGLVLTNNHVVEGVESVTVHLGDGGSFPGRVVGRDFLRDMALVRINASGLPTITFGDSKTLRLGQQVIALGFPGGLEGGVTVTSGLVSAIRTDEKQNTVWVQTDSAVNPGNSGGPLITLSGEVVGMVTKKRVIIGGIPTEGLAFALSSGTIQTFLPGLKAG